MANENSRRVGTRILDEILANKRGEIERQLPMASSRFEEIFRNNLGRPVVIAEIKLQSPSAGILYEGDPLELVVLYEGGGAEAISVVTDRKYFGGSDDLFTEVQGYTTLPVLRK